MKIKLRRYVTETLDKLSILSFMLNKKGFFLIKWINMIIIVIIIIRLEMISTMTMIFKT